MRCSHADLLYMCYVLFFWCRNCMEWDLMYVLLQSQSSLFEPGENIMSVVQASLNEFPVPKGQKLYSLGEHHSKQAKKRDILPPNNIGVILTVLSMNLRWECRMIIMRLMVILLHWNSSQLLTVFELSGMLIEYRITFLIGCLLYVSLFFCLFHLFLSQWPFLELVFTPVSGQNSGGGSSGFETPLPRDRNEEEAAEKIKLLKQKTLVNASAVPPLLRRMSECISRINNLNSSKDSIHPAFKIKRDQLR